MDATNESGSRSNQKEYVVAGSRGLGGSQIFFASLLVTFGIVEIVIQTAEFFVAAPIWTGLVYLVTGILGVVSSHRNTKCLVISLLVMSCLSVLMTFAGIATAASALGKEHWNEFPGSVGCYYDYSIHDNHCPGLQHARFTFDAANLLFAMVELGLSIATIAVCSYTLCKKGCCNNGDSCCGNGLTGTSYQTVHEVGQDGRLRPLQGFANINYVPDNSAHAPSYVISTPAASRQGGVQQGM